MLNMINRLEIGPILRALTRNKVGAILIAFQIAVTMAIIVNAIFIVFERQQNKQRLSGVDEANSFYLSSVGFGADYDHKSTVEADLLMLRNMSGIVNAIQTNAVPISNSGWSMSLQTEPGAELDKIGTAVYMVDENALQTYDIKLIAGKNFTPNQIRWRESAQPDWPDSVMITKAMAESLFPDDHWQSAVGKTVYINDDEPMMIQGIVDKIQAPWVGWSRLEHVMLTPEKTVFSSSRYFIRTEPGRLDEMMKLVEEKLAQTNKNRIIRGMRSMPETRERTYRGDTAMIKILSTVMITLTIITALGIVGLASFSVNRRKKQIGTRRALGASQGAILRYFMLENFLISTVGVLIGAALTIGLNITLVNTLEVDPLPWFYIPAGMLVLWIVGQIAVYGPAKRAAGIAPAIATRTV